MSKTDEIKEWQTQSVKHKIAAVLMMDAKDFSFKPQTGIVFHGTEEYVSKLRTRMVMAYGCSQFPIINEIK